MAKSGKFGGRVNNSPNYRDREPGRGEKEYLGERLEFGHASGGVKKRLMNEIDDNKYEPVEIIVGDDPAAWGEDFQVHFVEKKRANDRKMLKKYVEIAKRTYDWLKNPQTKLAKTVTSFVEVRASVGMTRRTWLSAEDRSEEFLYYSTLIKELLAARIHYLGVNVQGNQVFKIFSIKNQLPEEFADKKENTNIQRIEVIEVKQGTDKEIKQLQKERKEKRK